MKPLTALFLTAGIGLLGQTARDLYLELDETPVLTKDAPRRWALVVGVST